jgi:hypothetical protein
MPAPGSTRPARRPWLTWAASLLFLAATIAAPLASRWLSGPEGLPPTHQHHGRTEVFLRSPHAWDGKWLPLVEARRSPLLHLIHQDLPPGSVAPINADGTVLITDNAVGNTRAIRQAEQGARLAPALIGLLFAVVKSGAADGRSQTAVYARRSRLGVPA